MTKKVRCDLKGKKCQYLSIIILGSDLATQIIIVTQKVIRSAAYYHFQRDSPQNIFYERKQILIALSVSRANNFTRKLVKLFGQLDADNTILIGFHS